MENLKVTPIFVGQILCHHRQRRQAIGVEHDDTFLRGLADFGRKLKKQEMGDLGRAAYLKGVRDQCEAEAKQMVEAADTPEKRREILPVVTALGQQAEDATKELEELAHG